MSRKDKCWNNAAIESFLSTLKWELLSDHPLGSRLEVRSLVFEYIETWCNGKRVIPHLVTSAQLNSSNHIVSKTICSQ